MSQTIYTEEEIEILQKRIIDYISNKCLKCEKPKSINNLEKQCSNIINNERCCFNSLNLTEAHKKTLIANLQKYKIIGCKFKYESENYMEQSWNSNAKDMRTKVSIYIHYINIHGELYSNNNIGTIQFSIEDIITKPFCPEGYKKLGPVNGCYSYVTFHGSHHVYIKKSFIIPKYLLNIILMTDYFGKIDIISSSSYDNLNTIIVTNIYNNIYVNFMKYIIKENDAKYNILFYHSRDLDLEIINNIEINNEKEIAEYYDNIEKERQRKIQEELDRIAKEKQDEIDRIAREKQEKIDKENEIKRIARGNITIEKNTITIEKNTYDNINLCEYLPYKNKKICDDSGSIKNIRYTEITHITFINCKLSEISKYYTGITHLTFIKCNNFKTMSRYLKAELKYLKINDEILFDKVNVYSV